MLRTPACSVVRSISGRALQAGKLQRSWKDPNRMTAPVACFNSAGVRLPYKQRRENSGYSFEASAWRASSANWVMACEVRSGAGRDAR